MLVLGAAYTILFANANLSGYHIILFQNCHHNLIFVEPDSHRSHGSRAICLHEEQPGSNDLQRNANPFAENASTGSRHATSYDAVCLKFVRIHSEFEPRRYAADSEYSAMPSPLQEQVQHHQFLENTSSANHNGSCPSRINTRRHASPQASMHALSLPFFGPLLHTAAAYTLLDLQCSCFTYYSAFT